MPADELERVIGYVTQLYTDVDKLIASDPDQEVGEREYGLIDRILQLGLPYVGDDPVVQEIRQLFSVETIAAKDPIRAAHVLSTVGALKHRLEQARYDQPGATRRRRSPG